MNVIPGLACYLASLLLAAVSPLLPLRFIGTTLALAALSFVGGRLLEGPLHPSEQGLGFAFLMALLQMFLGIVALSLGLRFVIAAATGYFRKPLSPRKKAQAQTYRRVAFVAAGIVAGLALALGLANGLAGTSGGWYLDLGIALMAAGAAASILRRYPASAARPVAAALLTLALIAVVGATQAGRIVTLAERQANGRPWCLVGPGGTPAITSTMQLGFFSLPKAMGYPHLALRIQDGDAVEEGHWSIRRQSLEPGWGTGVAFCRPRDDYGTALRNGELGPD